MRKLLFVLPLICLFAQVVSAYEIKGQINITDDWQPRIYLASIQSPENLFVASPEFVINEGMIDTDGNFVLSGQDLPDDSRFYRLYLIRSNSFAIEFTNDTRRNFIHLLLDNSSQLTIRSQDGSELFAKIQIEGSEGNKALAGFEDSYFLKRRSLNEINTVAKRDFQSQSLNRSIREFVNQSEDPMVGLFALYHIEDRETDFLRNSNFYFDFQERMKSSYPKALYTSVYDDMLNNLVGYRDLVCEIPKITKPWRTWIIWGEALVIFMLCLWIWKLKMRQREEDSIDYFQLLTDKERKIWEGLAAGKTNKEIAAELFVEISTVKTHINNLYKRLGVSNRKEAISLYNSNK
ncbi:response regulator transcription factor [Mangrovibacterium lignilyticum]|uniref:response regulator transcription factor n=1 Tax=Mangrovibacterium lignilyticum TaxID=2668052 RepID=UPI0013D45A40|nr:helix-turn-helix transcriptional regulator [Mangrovibacterium lignilyticum]